jgi:uncharacterized membrane protein
MEIFHRPGLEGAFIIAHVIVAIMWMGLLWFFNFVQTPAYAEMDPSARNAAFDKVTWRALWWFRWAAAATVAFGLLILGAGGFKSGDDFDKTFWLHSTAGPTLLLGIVMGIVMFANVWSIIWPKQQIVIGNARNLLAGGEANPDAAAAARAGAMASRQNTIFSLPLLVFMVGATHFYGKGPTFANLGLSTGKTMTYLIVGLIIIAVLELNAVGKISGRGSGGLNVIYETHKNAMYTGFGLIVFFYIFAEILLRH